MARPATCATRNQPRRQHSMPPILCATMRGTSSVLFVSFHTNVLCSLQVVLWWRLLVDSRQRGITVLSDSTSSPSCSMRAYLCHQLICCTKFCRYTLCSLETLFPYKLTLSQQCVYGVHADADNFRKERRMRYFRNILKLCKEWSEMFPYDFVSDLMMQRLSELLSLCAQDHQSQHLCATLMGALRKMNHCHIQSTPITANLRSKLNKLERYEAALMEISKQQSASHLLPNDHWHGIASIVDKPILVAHQLTHIELERLGMIGAEEFVYSLIQVSFPALPVRTSHIATLRKRKAVPLITSSERCRQSSSIASQRHITCSTMSIGSTDWRISSPQILRRY